MKVEFAGAQWSGQFVFDQDGVKKQEEIMVFAKDIEEAVKEALWSLKHGYDDNFELISMEKVGEQPEGFEVDQEVAEKLEAAKKKVLN